MRLKPLALGSAAALALALGANTSFAQTTTNDQSAPAQNQAAPADNATNGTTDTTTAPKATTHHYRHHVRHSAQTADETPAEQEQTVDLNKQELTKVDNQTSPGTNGGNTAANTAPATNTAANTAPATNSASNMSAQNSSPADKTANGTADASKDQSVAQNTPSNDASQAKGTSSHSQSASGTNVTAKASLDTVRNPKQTLASATVQNSNGQQIGQVKGVKVGSDGKTQAVDVQVIGQGGAAPKTVRLDANDLSYDKDNNVLVTPLSSDQVNSMPTSPM
jgi:hypothetical protein